VALIAWGTSYPGYHSWSTYIGVWLLVSWTLGVIVQMVASFGMEHPIPARFRDNAVGWALAAAAILMLLAKPTMYLRFYASLPALRAEVDRVRAMPFTEARGDGGWVGFYDVCAVRRCPHGACVIMSTADRTYGSVYAGFMYAGDDPGVCTKYVPGRTLGFGWYEVPACRLH
jgi:hypothetical protein